MLIKEKINTHEAAKILGVRPNTLERWRSKNKGPRYSKIGSRVLYDSDDLIEFFNGRSIDTAESEALRKHNQKKY